MNKYADKPQSISRILDGVWMSINNSGKSGVREWVEKIRNAANMARYLEKRNRKLEDALEIIKNGTVEDGWILVAPQFVKFVLAKKDDQS